MRLSDEIKLELMKYFRFQRSYNCVCTEGINNADVNAYNGTSLVEVEVKISKADFKKEFQTEVKLDNRWKIYKHRNYSEPHKHIMAGYIVPNRFYMCVPVKLAEWAADYLKDKEIDAKQLFKLESVMDYVVEREGFVAQNVERLKHVVALPHSPLVNIGTQCNNPYPCDFQGHCWKLIPKNSFLYTTAMEEETLFQNYFSGINSNEKMLRQVASDSLEARQIEALETNSYYIDYKTLYSLTPQPKPKSIAFLNLLLHRPAVPEIDGTKPYEEMILAFALQGEHEDEGNYVWDCFDDHSRWKASIPILIEKLSRYDLIVCFTPQNFTTILLRHEIIQNKEVGYKVFNLFDVLQQANFYHPSIKRGFTLQRLSEALFPAFKLFEHSRILVEATSRDLIGYQQAKEDLITENEMVAKTYQHFFK